MTRARFSSTGRCSQATCPGRWRECTYLTCDHEYSERSPLCRVPVRSVAAIGSDLGDFVLLERLESEPGPRFDVALATVDSQQHSHADGPSPDDRVGMAWFSLAFSAPISTLFIFFNPDGYSPTKVAATSITSTWRDLSPPHGDTGAQVSPSRTSTLGPGTQDAFLMVWQRGNDGDWISVHGQLRFRVAT